MVSLSAPLAAQAPRGSATLRATVTDEVGGPIVGARITVLGSGTEHVLEGATNDKGEVTLEGLAPGEYTLKAASPGFRETARTVRLNSGQSRQVQLRLPVEVTEVVDVTALKRPLPERENIDQNADAINVDDDLMVGVPMAIGGDQVLSFVSRFMLPAAGPASIVVDGEEVSRLNLPARAIDEIVVNKNPYSAEYRRPGRSRVEVLAQDGSQSHYHADVTAIGTSSGLSAPNPFVRAKPDFSQWNGQMGFSGPLHTFKGSYLFAGEFSGMDTFGAVNALTLGGPIAQFVPEQERQNYGTARVDLDTTDRVHLTFRYELDEGTERNETVGGFSLGELGINHDTRAQDFWFEADHILTANLVHKPRIRVGYQTETEGNEPHGSLVVVQGAFQGGVNQRFKDTSLVEADIQDTATYHRGVQTMTFGGKFNPQLHRNRDLSNFGGTYEFSNLDLFAAGRPYVFRINSGDPSLSYMLETGEAFFNDDIKLRPDFTLMVGGRYDWESIVPDHDNVAPRIAFAFAPGDRRWAVRGGAGVFYERLGGKGFEQVELYGGSRIHTLVYDNPAYPNAAGAAGSTPAPTIYRFSPAMATPYLTQASVAVDRQFGLKTSLSAEYTYLRGYDLYRVRDLNAPQPGTGLRPDPSFENVVQIEPTGGMTSQALQITLNGKFFHDFKGSAVYTYARTSNDIPGTDRTGQLSLNPPSTSHEWGRADFDRRHDLTLAGVYDGIPGQFELGAILEANSGVPYDITTGFDDNGDGLANDRPAGLPRNAGVGPRFVELDVRLKKVFETARPLRYPQAKPGKLECYVDAFDVLNTINYTDINGVMSSPRFGLPTLSEKNRLIQAGLSFSF